MSPNVNYWRSQWMLWVITLQQTLDTSSQARSTVTACPETLFHHWNQNWLNLNMWQFKHSPCYVCLNWWSHSNQFRGVSATDQSPVSLQIWVVTGIYRRKLPPPPPRIWCNVTWSRPGSVSLRIMTSSLCGNWNEAPPPPAAITVPVSSVRGYSEGK